MHSRALLYHVDRQATRMFTLSNQYRCIAHALFPMATQLGTIRTEILSADLVDWLIADESTDKLHSEDLPADLPNWPDTRPFFSSEDKEIENAIAAGVSKKTSVDTNYCVRIWNEWAICKQRASGTIVTPIETLSHSELQYYWLQRIILEVRRKKKTMPEGGYSTVEYLPSGT